MSTYCYNVSDIKSLIKESATEFKPVLGPNVESDNKKNNERVYKDVTKQAKDYDGGLNTQKENGKSPKKEDFNATTLDYNPRVEPDKAWKEKVEAQAKGYTSKMEEDNGIEKAAQFDDKGKIYNQFKDANTERQKERNDLANAGLTAKEMPKREKPVMTESKPKTKILTFKHTRFINEAQMLARIPEDYKVDGQKIYMRDAHNNEYIVECVQGNKTGVIETNIVSFKNQDLINEQKNRIQELFNYKPSSTSGRNALPSVLNEEKNFKDLMDISRGRK